MLRLSRLFLFFIVLTLLVAPINNAQAAVQTGFRFSGMICFVQSGNVKCLRGSTTNEAVLAAWGTTGTYAVSSDGKYISYVIQSNGQAWEVETANIGIPNRPSNWVGSCGDISLPGSGLILKLAYTPGYGDDTLAYVCRTSGSTYVYVGGIQKLNQRAAPVYKSFRWYPSGIWSHADDRVSILDTISVKLNPPPGIVAFHPAYTAYYYAMGGKVDEVHWGAFRKDEPGGTIKIGRTMVVRFLDVAPDGNFVVSDGTNLLVSKSHEDNGLYSLNCGLDCPQAITGVTWSPDYRYLAVTASDGLRIYNAATRSLTDFIPMKKGGCSNPQWSK